MKDDTKEGDVPETAPQYKPKDKTEPVRGEQGMRCTYEEYCSLPDRTRWELIDGMLYEKAEYPEEIIDGVPYLMSAPGRRHQEILIEIARQFGNYLQGKTCKVYVAPFDIYLNDDEKDKLIIEPDISIICDHSKLTDKGASGAPDMTVEIISPSSIKRDRFDKLKLYEQYGVREYWIVDPDAEIVHVHELVDGRYRVSAYTFTDDISAGIFEDCVISLADVVAER